MPKKLLSLCLCLLLLLGSLVPAAQAAPITSGAQSVALMEKETGTLIYAENEHERLEPASVTKVMTLLLVMEAIDDGRLHYEDMLSASDHAASMGGSQVYLKAGEQMSVEDLLKAVCMASGNDAAVCLAEAVAGSEESFVERMNQRARRASHFSLRYRPHVPGADSESPGYPPLHHTLDGLSAGRRIPAGQHE